ncbi:hypothetical protein HHI36_014064 [Cryptolaemus montrouzieri]|uniref:Uncharacterized protein n=1 Tax=Cryptolaemus montrouzieri TaxID=559131 RepID=A0ABD2N1S2_9CUCU
MDTKMTPKQIESGEKELKFSKLQIDTGKEGDTIQMIKDGEKFEKHIPLKESDIEVSSRLEKGLPEKRELREKGEIAKIPEDQMLEGVSDKEKAVKTGKFLTEEERILPRIPQKHEDRREIKKPTLDDATKKMKDRTGIETGQKDFTTTPERINRKIDSKLTPEEIETRKRELKSFELPELMEKEDYITQKIKEKEKFDRKFLPEETDIEISMGRGKELPEMQDLKEKEVEKQDYPEEPERQIDLDGKKLFPEKAVLRKRDRRDEEREITAIGTRKGEKIDKDDKLREMLKYPHIILEKPEIMMEGKVKSEDFKKKSLDDRKPYEIEELRRQKRRSGQITEQKQRKEIKHEYPKIEEREKAATSISPEPKYEDSSRKPQEPVERKQTERPATAQATEESRDETEVRDRQKDYTGELVRQTSPDDRKLIPKKFDSREKKFESSRIPEEQTRLGQSDTILLSRKEKRLPEKHDLRDEVELDKTEELKPSKIPGDTEKEGVKTQKIKDREEFGQEIPPKESDIEAALTREKGFPAKRDLGERGEIDEKTRDQKIKGIRDKDKGFKIAEPIRDAEKISPRVPMETKDRREMGKPAEDRETGKLRDTIGMGESQKEIESREKQLKPSKIPGDTEKEGIKTQKIKDREEFGKQIPPKESDIEAALRREEGFPEKRDLGERGEIDETTRDQTIKGISDKEKGFELAEPIRDAEKISPRVPMETKDQREMGKLAEDRETGKLKDTTGMEERQKEIESREKELKPSKIPGDTEKEGVKTQKIKDREEFGKQIPPKESDIEAALRQEKGFPEKRDLGKRGEIDETTRDQTIKGISDKDKGFKLAEPIRDAEKISPRVPMETKDRREMGKPAEDRETGKLRDTIGMKEGQKEIESREKELKPSKIPGDTEKEGVKTQKIKDREEFGKQIPPKESDIEAALRQEKGFPEKRDLGKRGEIDETTRDQTIKGISDKDKGFKLAEPIRDAEKISPRVPMETKDRREMGKPAEDRETGKLRDTIGIEERQKEIDSREKELKPSKIPGDTEKEGIKTHEIKDKEEFGKQIPPKESDIEAALRQEKVFPEKRDLGERGERDETTRDQTIKGISDKDKGFKLAEPIRDAEKISPRVPMETKDQREMGKLAEDRETGKLRDTIGMEERQKEIESREKELKPSKIPGDTEKEGVKTQKIKDREEFGKQIPPKESDIEAALRREKGFPEKRELGERGEIDETTRDQTIKGISDKDKGFKLAEPIRDAEKISPRVPMETKDRREMGKPAEDRETGKLRDTIGIEERQKEIDSREKELKPSKIPGDTEKEGVKTQKIEDREEFGKQIPPKESDIEAALRREKGFPEKRDLGERGERDETTRDQPIKGISDKDKGFKLAEPIRDAEKISPRVPMETKDQREMEKLAEDRETGKLRDTIGMKEGQKEIESREKELKPSKIPGDTEKEGVKTQKIEDREEFGKQIPPKESDIEAALRREKGFPEKRDLGERGERDETTRDQTIKGISDKDKGFKLAEPIRDAEKISPRVPMETKDRREMGKPAEDRETEKLRDTKGMEESQKEIESREKELKPSKIPGDTEKEGVKTQKIKDREEFGKQIPPKESDTEAALRREKGFPEKRDLGERGEMDETTRDQTIKGISDNDKGFKIAEPIRDAEKISPRVPLETKDRRELGKPAEDRETGKLRDTIGMEERQKEIESREKEFKPAKIPGDTEKEGVKTQKIKDREEFSKQTPLKESDIEAALRREKGFPEKRDLGERGERDEKTRDQTIRGIRDKDKGFKIAEPIRDAEKISPQVPMETKDRREMGKPAEDRETEKLRDTIGMKEGQKETESREKELKPSKIPGDTEKEGVKTQKIKDREEFGKQIPPKESDIEAALRREKGFPEKRDFGERGEMDETTRDQTIKGISDKDKGFKLAEPIRDAEKISPRVPMETKDRREMGKPAEDRETGKLRDTIGMEERQKEIESREKELKTSKIPRDTEREGIKTQKIKDREEFGKQIPPKASDIEAALRREKGFPEKRDLGERGEIDETTRDQTIKGISDKDKGFKLAEPIRDAEKISPRVPMETKDRREMGKPAEDRETEKLRDTKGMEESQKEIESREKELKPSKIPGDTEKEGVKTQKIKEREEFGKQIPPKESDIEAALRQERGFPEKRDLGKRGEIDETTRDQTIKGISDKDKGFKIAEPIRDAEKISPRVPMETKDRREMGKPAEDRETGKLRDTIGMEERQKKIESREKEFKPVKILGDTEKEGVKTQKIKDREEFSKQTPLKESDIEAALRREKGFPEKRDLGERGEGDEKTRDQTIKGISDKDKGFKLAEPIRDAEKISPRVPMETKDRREMGKPAEDRETGKLRDTIGMEERQKEIESREKEFKPVKILGDTEKEGVKTQKIKDREEFSKQTPLKESDIEAALRREKGFPEKRDLGERGEGDEKTRDQTIKGISDKDKGFKLAEPIRDAEKISPRVPMETKDRREMGKPAEVRETGKLRDTIGMGERQKEIESREKELKPSKIPGDTEKEAVKTQKIKDREEFGKQIPPKESDIEAALRREKGFPEKRDLGERGEIDETTRDQTIKGISDKDKGFELAEPIRDAEKISPRVPMETKDQREMGKLAEDRETGKLRDTIGMEERQKEIESREKELKLSKIPGDTEKEGVKTQKIKDREEFGKQIPPKESDIEAALRREKGFPEKRDLGKRGEIDETTRDQTIKLISEKDKGFKIAEPIRDAEKISPRVPMETKDRREMGKLAEDRETGKLRDTIGMKERQKEIESTEKELKPSKIPGDTEKEGVKTQKIKDKEEFGKQIPPKESDIEAALRQEKGFPEKRDLGKRGEIDETTRDQTIKGISDKDKGFKIAEPIRDAEKISPRVPMETKDRREMGKLAEDRETGKLRDTIGMGERQKEIESTEKELKPSKIPGDTEKEGVKTQRIKDREEFGKQIPPKESDIEAALRREKGFPEKRDLGERGEIDQKTRDQTIKGIRDKDKGFELAEPIRDAVKISPRVPMETKDRREMGKPAEDREAGKLRDTIGMEERQKEIESREKELKPSKIPGDTEKEGVKTQKIKDREEFGKQIPPKESDIEAALRREEGFPEKRDLGKRGERDETTRDQTIERISDKDKGFKIAEPISDAEKISPRVPMETKDRREIGKLAENRETGNLSDTIGMKERQKEIESREKELKPSKIPGDTEKEGVKTHEIKDREEFGKQIPPKESDIEATLRREKGFPEKRDLGERGEIDETTRDQSIKGISDKDKGFELAEPIRDAVKISPRVPMETKDQREMGKLAEDRETGKLRDTIGMEERQKEIESREKELKPSKIPGDTEKEGVKTQKIKDREEFGKQIPPKESDIEAALRQEKGFPEKRDLGKRVERDETTRDQTIKGITDKDKGFKLAEPIRDAEKISPRFPVETIDRREMGKPAEDRETGKKRDTIGMGERQKEIESTEKELKPSKIPGDTEKEGVKTQRIKDREEFGKQIPPKESDIEAALRREKGFPEKRDLGERGEIDQKTRDQTIKGIRDKDKGFKIAEPIRDAEKISPRVPMETKDRREMGKPAEDREAGKLRDTIGMEERQKEIESREKELKPSKIPGDKEKEGVKTQKIKDREEFGKQIPPKESDIEAALRQEKGFPEKRDLGKRGEIDETTRDQTIKGISDKDKGFKIAETIRDAEKISPRVPMETKDRREIGKLAEDRETGKLSDTIGLKERQKEIESREKELKPSKIPGDTEKEGVKTQKIKDREEFGKQIPPKESDIEAALRREKGFPEKRDLGERVERDETTRDQTIKGISDKDKGFKLAEPIRDAEKISPRFPMETIDRREMGKPAEDHETGKLRDTTGMEERQKKIEWREKELKPSKLPGDTEKEGVKSQEIKDREEYGKQIPPKESNIADALRREKGFPEKRDLGERGEIDETTKDQTIKGIKDKDRGFKLAEPIRDAEKISPRVPMETKDRREMGKPAEDRETGKLRDTTGMEERQKEIESREKELKPSKIPGDTEKEGVETQQIKDREEFGKQIPPKESDIEDALRREEGFPEKRDLGERGERDETTRDQTIKRISDKDKGFKIAEPISDAEKISPRVPMETKDRREMGKQAEDRETGKLRDTIGMEERQKEIESRGKELKPSKISGDTEKEGVKTQKIIDREEFGKQIPPKESDIEAALRREKGFPEKRDLGKRGEIDETTRDQTIKGISDKDTGFKIAEPISDAEKISPRVPMETKDRREMGKPAEDRETGLLRDTIGMEDRRKEIESREKELKPSKIPGDTEKEGVKTQKIKDREEFGKQIPPKESDIEAALRREKGFPEKRDLGERGEIDETTRDQTIKGISDKDTGFKIAEPIRDVEKISPRFPMETKDQREMGKPAEDRETGKLRDTIGIEERQKEIESRGKELKPSKIPGDTEKEGVKTQKIKDREECGKQIPPKESDIEAALRREKGFPEKRDLGERGEIDETTRDTTIKDISDRDKGFKIAEPIRDAEKISPRVPMETKDRREMGKPAEDRETGKLRDTIGMGESQKEIESREKELKPSKIPGDTEKEGVKTQKIKDREEFSKQIPPKESDIEYTLRREKGFPEKRDLGERGEIDETTRDQTIKGIRDKDTGFKIAEPVSDAEKISPRFPMETKDWREMGKPAEDRETEKVRDTIGMEERQKEIESRGKELKPSKIPGDTEKEGVKTQKIKDREEFGKQIPPKESDIEAALRREKGFPEKRDLGERGEIDETTRDQTIKGISDKDKGFKLAEPIRDAEKISPRVPMETKDRREMGKPPEDRETGKLRDTIGMEERQKEIESREKEFKPAKIPGDTEKEGVKTQKIKDREEFSKQIPPKESDIEAALRREKDFLKSVTWGERRNR